MYSILQRANGVSAFATSSLITLLVALAIVGYLSTPSSLEPGRIEISNIDVSWGRDSRDYHERSSREWANVRFDLQADLQPLFNYNTKQLFIYLTADYHTDKYPDNRVVIWDRIVRRYSDAKINISGGKNKYAFKEIAGSFKNVSATFTLQYNLMPHVGVLTWGQAGQTTTKLDFPPRRIS